MPLIKDGGLQCRQLGMFAAIRRAPSRVSRLAAERRPGSTRNRPRPKRVGNSKGDIYSLGSLPRIEIFRPMFATMLKMRFES